MSWKILNLVKSTDRRIDIKIESPQGKRYDLALIFSETGKPTIYSDNPQMFAEFNPAGLGCLMAVDYFGHPFED